MNTESILLYGCIGVFAFIWYIILRIIICNVSIGKAINALHKYNLAQIEMKQYNLCINYYDEMLENLDNFLWLFWKWSWLSFIKKEYREQVRIYQ